MVGSAASSANLPLEDLHDEQTKEHLVAVLGSMPPFFILILFLPFFCGEKAASTSPS